jgi:hypothetical protein
MSITEARSIQYPGGEAMIDVEKSPKTASPTQNS